MTKVPAKFQNCRSSTHKVPPALKAQNVSLKKMEKENKNQKSEEYIQTTCTPSDHDMNKRTGMKLLEELCTLGTLFTLMVIIPEK